MSIPRTSPAQRREALEAANATRLAGRDLRAELSTGRIELAEALEDPRSARMSISKLLLGLPGWGPRRSGRLLMLARISYAREVGELTARQKADILARVDAGSTAPVSSRA